MRVSATQIGFLEDPDGEEVLLVGIAGIDDDGVERSFEIQRSTYGPDEQDVECGMDSYCVSTDQGLTAYGCLRAVRLAGRLLGLTFTDEDAEELDLAVHVAVDLGGVDVEVADLASRLREIVHWGAMERHPELAGDGFAGQVVAE